jgi:hypothetical protein
MGLAPLRLLLSQEQKFGRHTHQPQPTLFQAVLAQSVFMRLVAVEMVLLQAVDVVVVAVVARLAITLLLPVKA